MPHGLLMLCAKLGVNHVLIAQMRNPRLWETCLYRATPLGNGRAEKEMDVMSFQEERKTGGQQADLLGSALSPTPSHRAFLRIDFSEGAL